MTIEAVRYFTTVLNLPEIVAELGVTNGEPNIYWDLAEDETTYPFVIFELSDEGYSSKRHTQMQYTAKVKVFAKSLTDAVSIGSKLRVAVKEHYNNDIYDRGSIHGYADGEAKDAFMEITFQFKHN